MAREIIIAIDGFASSGKSTIAKQLAAALNYTYVDSGAFYRALTLYFLQNEIDWNREPDLNKIFSGILIDFKNPSTFLNGKNVETEIRSMTVSNAVSSVSAVPAVRGFISEKLREYGLKKQLVMDGRDIGSVVFPEAELKIFLTADEKIRSSRRFSEMKNSGIDITQDQVNQNLSGRDLTDSTRATAPLKKAPDAFVIDNTNLSLQEQFSLVLSVAKERIQQST